VADVLGRSRYELERLPNVGPTTANAVLAAARQIAHRAAAQARVRLDPDRRTRDETEFLMWLRSLDDAHRAVGPLEHAAGQWQSRIRNLRARTAVATNPMGLLFKGRQTKEAARQAVAELAALLSSPEAAAFGGELSGAHDVLANRLLDPDALWRDFEARASDYYALIGELSDADLDVTAAQGFLPAEIAERVHAQQLDDTFLQVSLRGYQAFGAKFALVQRRSILGDEMGLGKTIEALAAMAHLRAIGETHFLVVCPASVLVNWTLEVRRRSALAAYHVHGDGRDHALRRWTQEGGVAVTTYESLRALPMPDGLRFAMLVADEAHYVKNPDAKRTQAVLRWAPSAERVLFLTGTPMENRVEEFRNLVSYLQPEVAATVSGIDGLAGATAFRHAVAPVYLRRNQEDVLSELPERIDMDDWVEFEADDLDAYRAAVAEGNFMAMRRAAYTVGDPSRCAKLGRLVEILEESAEDGWKSVVFSYFLDVLHVVAETSPIRVFGPLTGSVSPIDRQKLVDEFAAFDEPAALVSQIQAGGVGLNIQAASVVVLTEPQWKPSVEEQAIARCHRMGQTRRVHVHRLLVKDSVDQRMLEIVDAKRALIGEYAERSSLKDATPDAVDISEVEATKRIVAEEQMRLGVTPASLVVDDDPDRKRSW
jgi:SNF2 family DNA or RNA helicase